MTDGQKKVEMYERLEHLNGEFDLIRNLMHHPEAFMDANSLVMDVLRLAIDYVHGLYEGLAREMKNARDIEGPG